MWLFSNSGLVYFMWLVCDQNIVINLSLTIITFFGQTIDLRMLGIEKRYPTKDYCFFFDWLIQVLKNCNQSIFDIFSDGNNLLGLFKGKCALVFTHKSSAFQLYFYIIVC